MRQYNIFPECYVDTNLVGFVLGGHVKHKSCCNEVMKAVNYSDEFAIGIIDDDKRRATMDAGFHEYQSPLAASNVTTHLSLYIHDDGKRYVITVNPAMDKFILDAAKSCNVSMANAGYPTTLKEFKKVTKTILAAYDSDLRNLFQLISDNPEMQQLRNTLKYLVHFQYRANADVLKYFWDGVYTSSELEKCLNANNPDPLD